MGTLVQNRQIISGLNPTNKLNPWRTSSFSILSGSSSGKPCATLSPVLDPQIWGNLHPELVTRILSNLPLKDLIHTTLVCRKWDREIFSGQILGHHRQDSSPPPATTTGALNSSSSSSSATNNNSWLFLFENGGPGSAHRLHAFDPLRNTWNIFTTIPHFATVQKIGGLALCGSASGLMLYKITALKSHFSRFGVFNPITGSWKKLPPLIRRRQNPVVIMFMDSSTKVKSQTSHGQGGHYKLVVAGGMEHEQQVASTEVYDSRSECWRISCEKVINQQNHVCEETRASTAFCDGVVYHMRFNHMMAFDPNREYHTLMAYETKGARWRAVRAPLPDELVFTEYPSLKRMWRGRPYLVDVFPPFLVESHGRLLLIGFLDDYTSIAGVGIWELQIAKKAWKPVTVMPPDLFSQMDLPKVCTSAYFEPPSYLRYEIQGAGRGSFVYIFQPCEARGAVVLCDLSHDPPMWRCVRQGRANSSPEFVNYMPKLQGCILDLRLDTLI